MSWSITIYPHAADPNPTLSKLVHEAASEGICFRSFTLGQSQPIKGSIGILQSLPNAKHDHIADLHSVSLCFLILPNSLYFFAGSRLELTHVYLRLPRSLRSLGKVTASITLYNMGLNKDLLGNTCLIFRGCC